MAGSCTRTARRTPTASRSCLRDARPARLHRGMRNALRRVPAPLLLAALGGFVIALYGVVHGLTVSLRGPVDRGDGTFSTLLAGGRTAASVLEVVGLAWLARRL